MIVSPLTPVWDFPWVGKLGALQDLGYSPRVVVASMSCKNFLFLSAILLLQVALISKWMEIKSSAVDLLCIQNKQNNNYPIPKNKKSAVTKYAQKESMNQRKNESMP